jgi:hypothetical protein
VSVSPGPEPGLEGPGNDAVRQAIAMVLGVLAAIAVLVAL